MLIRIKYSSSVNFDLFIYLIHTHRNPKKKIIKASNTKLADIKKKAMLLKQLNMNDVKVKALKSNGELFVEGLTNINAENCGIEIISSVFFEGSEKTLKTVNFNKNSLTEFPGLYKWTVLTTLKLNNNQLKEVPGEVANIISLKTLELSNNWITVFNNEVWKLPKLESVDLSYNKISNLPGELWKDTQLLWLNISYNDQLVDIPNELQ